MTDNLNRDLSQLLGEDTEAQLPTPDTDVPMVSRSLRLSVDLDQRIRALAEARGVGTTTLMRQLIEAGVAELDDTAVIPLADIHQALAVLARRYHHVA
ncbi:MAG: ribbon-helix-helix protein, CopG family [Micromonosporaceae bacterium]